MILREPDGRFSTAPQAAVLNLSVIKELFYRYVE